MSRDFIELYDDDGYRYIVNMDKISFVNVAGRKVWAGEVATLAICDESMERLLSRLVGEGEMSCNKVESEMRECDDIEKRRKIANRLRALDSKIVDGDALATAVDELRMAVCGNAAISPVECSVRNLVGFALELADLIEGNQYSGTCRNVYPNNEDHHCDNGFRCSVCGDTVEDCENYRVFGTWNYCPKCGAKVVG